MPTRFARATAFLLVVLIPPAVIAATVIQNPAQAPAHREITYREAWRAGAGEDDPVLGPIMDAVTDPGGNVYLLDSQQQVLHKFSPTGEYLGLAARKGQGPGEIEQVYQVCLLDDECIGMLKGFPAEIIVIGIDGRPRSSLKLQAPSFGGGMSFGMASSFAQRDGFIVVQGRVALYDGPSREEVDYVASIAPDGTLRHCYGSHRGGYDFTKPITVDETGDRFAYATWALGRDGEVYFAPDRDRWLIEVRDPDGALLRTITRPAEPHRRTAAEKEAAKENYMFSTNGAALPSISYRIADTDPVIGGLGFDGTHLIVNDTDRDPVEPGIATFDVLDAEGHLLERRTVRVPGCRRGDGLLQLENGAIVCVRNFEAAVASGQAGMQVQVGEHRREGARDDGAGELEVILYVQDGR